MSYYSDKRKVAKNGITKCSCGSVRLEVHLHKGDDSEDYNWITVQCKRCGNTIFSNGA